MTLKIIQSFFLLVILFCSCQAASFDKETEVNGVQNPVISLNGTWKFSMDIPVNPVDKRTDSQSWADIQVPGECQMQGFAIKHDMPCIYERRFFVPDDFKDKQILINFYGVYSYARVWVNGKFVREHFGGFTKWSCDITNLVAAGEPAILTVEVTDRMDDISYGSGYAKHQIGGILRDVELVALPGQNLKKLWFETDLDEMYENAVLQVFYELSRNPSSNIIRVELFDKSNNLIKRVDEKIRMTKGEFPIQVKNPIKWDAEHPNLYKVVVTLTENEKEILKVSERIGFREITLNGNKLLVNGKEVKLRGACRHDVNPLLGRVATPEYDRKDVLLAKEANINFIRTSHYPPSETFLKYCDEYGLYVEDETAVCFVGSHRSEAYRASGASQNDSAFTRQYLAQLEEQVQNQRSHPSIIIWSIGNECAFGDNFVQSYNWIKENDKTRPVIFSYPGHVPGNQKIYDIISMHYPDWRGNLNQLGVETHGFMSGEAPMLFDEWAHVACYNKYELNGDPNVRNYWGQGLDSMWTKAFEADGCLGGAIWGMIDETFMLPKQMPGFNNWWGILNPKITPPAYIGPCVGYGEWGIIDTWRREKPEFWLTKKAYSPTKIYIKQISSFQPGKNLIIPVHNRFDHTDFNELKITWEYGGQSGELSNINLPPHNKGNIIIPANDWSSGQKLNIAFFLNDTSLVDKYNIQLGERKIELPVCKKGNLIAEETKDQIYISGGEIVFTFNKRTGLIEDLSVNNEIIIESGPYMNIKLTSNPIQNYNAVIQDYAVGWKCTDFAFNIENGIASFNLEGIYDSISANFLIQIDENGVFNIDYKADGLPKGKNVEEIGLKFLVGKSFNKLRWDRNSYYTSYPKSHLGLLQGEIELTNKIRMNYREEPFHKWEMDTKGFYYVGLDDEFPYSNIVRSLKENIYSFSLITDKNSKIDVLSDGTQSCRFDKIAKRNTLIIDDEWDYTGLIWGNYMKVIKSVRDYRGKAVFKIGY